jgi:hypothetical protein
VREYRRAVPSARKSDLWHWHVECPFYPGGTFAVRQDKPDDDDLCARCSNLSART